MVVNGATSAGTLQESYIFSLLVQLWEVMKTIVPMGIDPKWFWTVLAITSFFVYFLLLKVPPFSENKNKWWFAGIVALVIAYFTASSAYVTVIISRFFPNIGLVLMIALGFFIFMAFISEGALASGSKFRAWIGIILLGVVILVSYFSSATELVARGLIPQGYIFGFSFWDVVLLIVIILVAGALINTLIPSQEGQQESVVDKFVKIFQGK